MFMEREWLGNDNLDEELHPNQAWTGRERERALEVGLHVCVWRGDGAVFIGKGNPFLSAQDL